ncbi:hypothetical protein MUK42_04160 [Musa troglodytarum]|uniref:DUF4378 domain-containing protein n=1 Tax=Musa troglodytarum TaxID=320322 RepID=A0A9E7GD26_9LILI|nr:hypothetical protein MUK42_04160 [Musa troglodytarum]URE12445.1 hypothetical protein MUK42_04160 [Musa troglodytarum]
MAQLLQHQDSNALCDKNHTGCVWSLLQYFDYHQHLPANKSPEDKNYGDAEHAGSTEYSRLYVPSISNQHDKSYREANSRVIKRNSGKALRDLILKNLFRKLHRKQKMLPVTPRLLRTFSIHHLECNDYVLPEEMSAESEIEVLEAQETDSLQSSEEAPLMAKDIKCQVCGSVDIVKNVGQDRLVELGDHLTENKTILVEKLHAAREAFLKQKQLVAKGIGTDEALQCKACTTMFELFNAHRDLFSKIMEDPNSVLEIHSQGLHQSNANKLLTKVGSFPLLRSPRRRNGQSAQVKHNQISGVHFVNEEVKSPLEKRSVSKSIDADLQAVPSSAGINVDMLKSESAVLNDYGVDPDSEFLPTSHEMENCTVHGTHLNSLVDITHENRNENHRISLDGFLHKIPYGQKVPEEVLTKKLFQSASARSFRDVSSDNFSFPPKVDPHQSIKRSRSVVDSSDRYSNFLNSISLGESKRLPETFISVKQYSSVPDRKTPRTFGRIHSNPEFRSYNLSRDIQGGLFHASLSLKESSIIPRDDETVDMYSLTKQESVETTLHMKGKMESYESTEQICNLNASGSTEKLPLVKLSETELGESCNVADSTTEYGGHVQLPQKDTGAAESPFLDSKFHQIDVPALLDSKQAGKGHIAGHELARIPKIDPSDEPTKQNQISDLDLCFAEDVDSSSKYAVSKDSTLRSLHLEGLNSLPQPANSLDGDISAGVETVESSSSNEQRDGLTSTDVFHIRVDQNDEAEFNYIRNVLMEPGFSGSAWYSRYQSVGPLLFGEDDCTFHVCEAASCDSDDTYLDHHLLSDLVNEVLFEIYEKSFARGMFLRIGPRVRPIPVGYHILEEVWPKISWHLSSKRQPIHTLENVMARDFATSNGWLNLQRDAESVGMELAGLISDDLLDELMPELTVG